MIKKILLIVAALAISVASAIEIPKASAKPLGVTKGKPCAEGLVFVNGKYLPPPYTVERWGVGIRINGTPVIAQVINWNEFLKTQPNVKVTKNEAAASSDPSDDMEEDEPDDYDMDDDDDSLDDLFDDDPKPAKKSPAKKPAKKPAKRRQAKPAATLTFTLEGPFVPNDKSNQLKQRINAKRDEINKCLAAGGYYFFGDKYAPVSGDSRTMEQVMKNLPKFMKECGTQDAFMSSVRSANLVFLSRPICVDLFANRKDYLRLQQRYDKWKSDRELKKVLNSSGSTSLL